jgi:hypothetical protein
LSPQAPRNNRGWKRNQEKGKEEDRDCKQSEKKKIRIILHICSIFVLSKYAVYWFDVYVLGKFIGEGYNILK